MVTFGALRAADFSALRTAADDWTGLPGRLTAGADWERLRKGLDAAGWGGEAARAAGPVMDTVTRQLRSAGDEAHGTGKLLDDAHHRFTAAQRSLNALVEEINAPGGPLTVDDGGTVTPRIPCGAAGPPGSAADTERRMGDYGRRIRVLLHEANEADEALYWALYQDPNGAGNDEFAPGAACTIDAAERGVTLAREDARAAARLAGRGGDLTAGQVRQLTGLLSRHRGDPEFGAAFATSLTARGALEMWARFSDPFGRSHDVGRREIDALRSALSRTLADATHYRSPAMSDWERRIVAAGEEPVEVYGGPGPSRPLGFQVMSSLMHEGTYDTGFLERYGDALMATDRRVTAADPAGWSRFGAVDGLDPRGHADPVSGLMDAMGRNPQASQAFLREPGRFRYLTHDRPWLENASGKAALGHALMSATTGHAFDVPAGAGTPAHTAGQASLMRQVVRYYARDGADDAKGPMAQSLGRMSAEYLPDLDRCLAGYDGRTTERILAGPGGATMGLKDPVEATEFLYNVANNPAGYAAISLGQTRYSTDLIGHHVAHPEAAGDLPLQTRVTEVARRGAALQEIIGQGRADAVVDGAVRSDASYNRALARGVEWTKATAGAAAGLAADVITENPFAGPYVEKGIETGAGDVLDTLTSGLTRDTTDAAGHDAVTITQGSMARYKEAVHTAVLSDGPPSRYAAIENGLSDGFDSGQDDGSRLYGDIVRKRGTG